MNKHIITNVVQACGDLALMCMVVAGAIVIADVATWCFGVNSAFGIVIDHGLIFVWSGGIAVAALLVFALMTKAADRIDGPSRA